MSEVINIVWLKRDIRSQNHAALHEAEAKGIPYIIIYIFDTDLIQYADTSLRHLQFVYHSIDDLNQSLMKYEREVEIFYGKSREVFSYLIASYNVNSVFSYEESGIQISWDRDKEVSFLFKKNGIIWKQSPTNGVIRGITNRKGWDKQWYATMSKPLIENRYSKNTIRKKSHSFNLPEKFKNQLEEYASVFQPAGEKVAWQYLRSFVE